MVLSSLAYVAYTRKNSQQQNSQQQTGEEDQWTFSEENPHQVKLFYAVLCFVVVVTAVCLAYSANKSSKENNPYAVVVIAFFLPEFYLAQAGIRAAMGTWHIEKIKIK